MTTYPTAYFAPCNPHNPLSAAALELRRAELELWIEYLPPLDCDFDLSCATLSAHTGTAPERVGSIIMAVHRLKELPLLAQAHAAHGGLDVQRLIVIDQVLAKLGLPGSDVIAHVDKALAAYFTPTKPGQELPTPAHIRRRLRDIIKALDETISFRKKKPRPSYSLSTEGGMSTIALEVEPHIGAAIDLHVRETANVHGLSHAAAATALLTGSVAPSPRVILHTYQATDVPDAPTYMEGYGWTTHTFTPDVVRDVAAPFGPAGGYRTPEIMAKFIEGRDGTCRVGGCTRPAHRSQKDHTVNYSDGGPTHPDNLVSLCQSHHNMKTEGRLRYIMDPATGDIVWLFCDGTWVVTEPTGPLSPESKRWVREVAEVIRDKRLRAREEAQNPDQPIVEIFDVSDDWAIDQEEEAVPF